MKKYIFILNALIGMVSFAEIQTGIGTKIPTTILEVVANTADNIVLDGITIPKRTYMQIINKQLNAASPNGTLQAGIIIYLTDTSGLCASIAVTKAVAKGVGFYGFNDTEFIKIRLDSGLDTTKRHISESIVDHTRNFIGTIDAQDLAIPTNSTVASENDGLSLAGVESVFVGAAVSNITVGN